MNIQLPNIQELKLTKKENMNIQIHINVDLKLTKKNNYSQIHNNIHKN
jgi:hypothetical protein